MTIRGAAAALALAVLAASGAVAAPPARAATCADFPNQAAAQRAANTRDGDGDGIYCEALPCPCSTARAPSHGTGHRPPSHHLGPTIRLGPLRRRANCHVNGDLPDAGCTPGTRYAHATRSVICAPGYAQRVRNVTQASRDAVYGAYGIVTAFDGTNGQLDHLVSLELGGTNARANLWPQAAGAGAEHKDRLENALHDEVCAGTLGLRRAQLLIARDWVAAYRARFG